MHTYNNGFDNNYLLYMQTYGHDKVSILDGGLPKWLATGYPTVSGPQSEVSVCTYKATYHPELYRTFEQMMENRSTGKEQVHTHTHTHTHNVHASMYIVLCSIVCSVHFFFCLFVYICLFVCLFVYLCTFVVFLFVCLFVCLFVLVS